MWKNNVTYIVNTKHSNVLFSFLRSIFYCEILLRKQNKKRSIFHLKNLKPRQNNHILQIRKYDLKKMIFRKESAPGQGYKLSIISKLVNKQYIENKKLSQFQNSQNVFNVLKTEQLNKTIKILSISVCCTSTKF